MFETDVITYRISVEYFKTRGSFIHWYEISAEDRRQRAQYWKGRSYIKSLRCPSMRKNSIWNSHSVCVLSPFVCIWCFLSGMEAESCVTFACSFVRVYLNRESDNGTIKTISCCPSNPVHRSERGSFFHWRGNGNPGLDHEPHRKVWEGREKLLSLRSTWFKPCPLLGYTQSLARWIILGGIFFVRCEWK